MTSSTNYNPSILSALTYEMVKGHPVLYQGHQAVTRGQKSILDLYAEPLSYQHFLSELCFNLHADFGREFSILSNPQLRLHIDDNNIRAINVAVVKKNTRKRLDSDILQEIPEFVFIIGTKASLIDLPHPFSYYHIKAKDLLNFGVQKVVWVFPEKQQIMVASKSRERWPLQNWNKPVELEPSIWWECPTWVWQEIR